MMRCACEYVRVCARSKLRGTEVPCRTALYCLHITAPVPWVTTCSAAGGPWGRRVSGRSIVGQMAYREMANGMGLSQNRAQDITRNGLARARGCGCRSNYGETLRLRLKTFGNKVTS